ncbi:MULTISPECIES: Ppx/GppA phosphatase family protein [Streptomyces]|uniref:Ppx/GppA phosphatase family protein n=1 Tax=Streptomyces TaxID=1883 RepID=UPI00224888D2|nr:Ppx/GppA family phosphatase [Streptomyces sp. JHD 1]MCX2969857.1 Ppx/GppA family phosphatase [Streptomyces sp. JHD 1]
MKLGVLDVGSNTAHLLVVDGADGDLEPVLRAKERLRLAERLGPGGRLDRACVDRMARAVETAVAKAERAGAEELLVYATAVVRDAPNRDEVLTAVRRRTGVTMEVLPGRREAELTLLAARRWMGHRAGPMAVLDVGGGSFEVACGTGESARFAASLPMGAGRLTREFFGHDDPPSPQAVRALRHHVREAMDEVCRHLRTEAPSTAVATSRTFQQLARLCGAPPARKGPLVPRRLARRDVKKAAKRLAAAPAAERATWPGISAARARQSAAGAIVAHTVMKLAGIDEVHICPWALREGALLHHLNTRPAAAAPHAAPGLLTPTPVLPPHARAA